MALGKGEEKAIECALHCMHGRLSVMISAALGMSEGNQYFHSLAGINRG